MMTPRSFRARLVLLAWIGAWAVPPLAVTPAAAQAAASKAATQERLKRVGAELITTADPARITQATEELKSILAVDPTLAEAHMLLGIAYGRQGSPDMMGEAVAEFRQALDLNPKLAPARLYLARVYLDLGRAARAREELDAALAQVPGQPQFLAMLGETERQLKNPARAVEVLRESLKADGASAQARYYLGLALFDLGRRDEAIKELEAVVQSGAKAVEAYVSLGTAYNEAGRFDEAAEILSQGTWIDPARPDLRIQLARAYRSKGLLTKADEQLKLAAPKPDVPASPFAQHQQVEFDRQIEEGLLRLKQGRLDAAAAAFRKALGMDPNHEVARRHLAEVEKRLQQRAGKKPPKEHL
jgi:tetratricopeptide (TPR) repeat protein